MLGHFGFTERAADFAYRLFLQHQDLSRAWMTLSMLVLEEGRGEEGNPRLWQPAEVGPQVAVDLSYDDGSETFFVVEPDATLRQIDHESWEPDHSLVRAVTGLRVGDRFVGPDGREGAVRQVRHKYVARLHYVMANHAIRFPEIAGFRQISINVEQPGGLDALIAQVKSRHDWIQSEVDQYNSGPMILGILAHRVRMDTIEVAAGLISCGARLKVAVGNLEERDRAEQAVRRNRRRACVLDLLGYWTAWRMDALPVIVSTCGRLHLPQSVLDRLRARREHFEDLTRDGLKTAGYQDGKLVLNETPAEAFASLRDDVNRSIAWAEKNATISAGCC